MSEYRTLLAERIRCIVLEEQSGDASIEAIIELLKFRPFKPDRIRVDRGDYTRAGGDVVCSICGCCYYDHPNVRGYEWLHRACDGKLLKL